ncbi:MAG TPA: hypothetical protein VJT72_04245 [Pseudonocardiaceae bacterium]|nr:hypothetical protein [Pseudonocardiaceae bacterium]
MLDQAVALKRVSLAGVHDVQAELTRQRALREPRGSMNWRASPADVVHVGVG